jgi:signal transduction histidine kinase
MKKRLRLLIIAFTVSFAIMAGLSFYTLNQFTTAVRYSSQVDHNNRVLSQLGTIERLLNELDVQERGYMITRDSTYILKMQPSFETIFPETSELKQLIGEDPEEKGKLTLIRSDVRERLDIIKSNLGFLDTAQTGAVSPYFESGKKKKDDIISYLDFIRKRETVLLRDKEENRKKYEKITYSTMRYLLTVFAFVTVILFFIMIREIKRRISFQDELQHNLADLRRSHAELEQIAYAVSHDLQEPLRKIQVFSDRMLWMKKQDLDEESKTTLERINSSAARTQQLIGDLMTLTSLVKEDRLEPVSLSNALHDAWKGLGETVRGRNAQLLTDMLPNVDGNGKQLQLLFKSLLDNALKFSKEDISPKITIKCAKVDSAELRPHYRGITSQLYYQISIADDGIGFDEALVNKMFRIFQRLHNSDSGYDGKGIGLAICQRIMVNHNGYITASGKPGDGAVFTLYFPVKE